MWNHPPRSGRSPAGATYSRQRAQNRMHINGLCRRWPNSTGRTSAVRPILAADRVVWKAVVRKPHAVPLPFVDQEDHYATATRVDSTG